MHHLCDLSYNIIITHEDEEIIDICVGEVFSHIRVNPKEFEDNLEVHFDNCYEGEYKNSCKYGKNDCPAQPLTPKKVSEMNLMVNNVTMSCTSKPKQEKLEQEIVGYRLKPSIDKSIIDGILKNRMPIWNDEDKSVYFIRGHVGGSLVAKMKELQVLNIWFIPIYESEEVKSNWVKEHHLDYYYKEGVMSNEPIKQTVEEAALKLFPKYISDPYNPNEDLNKEERDIWIDGAKSDAARDYWYAKLKQEIS